MSGAVGPGVGDGARTVLPAWVGSITDAELDRLCGTGALTRGREYALAGRVLSVTSADRGRMLLGEVAGTRGEPYSTLVTHAGDTARGPSWVSRCSCPVGVRCKHAVALILAGRGRAATAGRSWSETLAEVLPPAGPVATGTNRLGLGVLVEQRPRSSGDHTPVSTVVVVPRKESRVRTWITTVSWPEIVGPAASAGVLPAHAAAARRLVSLASRVPAGSVPYDVPRTLELARLGPAVWGVLVSARRAGIELQGANPAETVELGEPVDIVCDVRGRPDGGVEASFAIVGAGVMSQIVPVGDPVHGLYVADLGGAGLVPVRAPVPGWVGEMLVSGTTLEIPPEDRGDFVRDYLPRLAAVVDVRDPEGLLRGGGGAGGTDGSTGTGSIEEVTGPLLLVRLRPDGSERVEVSLSMTYSRGARSSRFALHSDWDPQRDPVAEVELLEELDILDDIPGLVHRGRGGHRLVDSSTVLVGADLVEFLDTTLPELRDHPDVIVEELGELPGFEEADGPAEVEVRPLDEVRDWLSLHVTVTVDGEEVPFAELFAALVRGDEIMILPSGVWFTLDQPSLRRLMELIEESKGLRDKERPGVLRLHRHRVADIHDLDDLSVTDVAASRWVESARRLTELTGPDVDGGEAATSMPVPEGLRAELRPYQRAGFAWLSHLLDAGLGGVLADDMGLGKTLQTLAAVLRLKEAGRLDRPVLVVAPTSVLSAWSTEAARFAPDLRVVTAGTTARTARSPLGERIDGADIVVTSYAVARIDAAQFREHLWSLLVCDEAQFVKNPQAKTHHVLRSLRADSVVAITGTPMENSLMDLWAILALAAPGLFPRADDFVKSYRRPIESGDEVTLARLRRKVRPLMLRRTKAVVAAELPEKQLQVVSVPMTAAHERIYQQHLQRERQRVLRLLAEDPDANRVAILSSLTTLRQMALHPGLVDEDYLERTSAAKVDALLDQVRELAAEGHRALVFSSFTRFLRLVQGRLHDEGLTTAYLDGGTTDRASVVREFREGEAPVFLISLKAGGFGLTLTEADYVFVLDPWWNPAAEEQAIDRVHRIGQDRTVFVYRFVSAGTIEEKVVALQEHKRDLFSKVVDSGGSLTGRISAAEIRALLE
ncbi:helicase SNF2 [Nostocoides sp. F2B08]|uniref:DEAD/DEAH box helicase n=1 Tax=Nostocoides sp. F2B08 TaxID=2653936 RepID=UPI001263B59F|nr:DEAD/DEAH box helicase [Tetrasphaera sp. F2B08]KAB7743918.1 helicase SNF2 [Tetrasphaera sp. F2B08]